MDSVRSIFLWVHGQDDNLGDVVLRRPLIELLRPLGQMELYVGDGSPGFIEALRLQPRDRCHVSLPAWMRQLWRAAWQAPWCFVFKPGETSLNFTKLRRLLPLWPALVAGKHRRGRVLNLGAGIRESERLPSRMLRPLYGLADLTLWRDARSAELAGQGGVMPDWAFADGSPEALLDAGPRDHLTLCLRGDRPMPEADLLRALRQFAAAQGLKLALLTQVRRDEEVLRALARALGADLLDWGSRTHLQQELRVRALYRRSRLVVSDRLHALIMGLTEGAVPLGLVTESGSDRPDKLRRPFDCIGYSGAAIDLRGAEAEAVGRALHDALLRQTEARQALHDARARIAEVAAQVRNLLG
jgi:hypothetical protein